MAIATVNPGNTITAQKYNEIQAQIDAVLGKNSAGYGSSPSSIPVTVNDIIKAEHYTKLYNDIRRCRVHQAGTAVSFPNGAVAPAVGDVITAAFTNNLIAAADLALANRYTVAASQLSNQISNQSTFPFDRSYVHSITYTWASNNDLRYYFNLGGRIEVQLGYSGSAVSPLESLWVAAVGVANAAMQTYDRADFMAGGVNSSKTLYTNNGSTDIILVRVTQISSVALQVTVELSPSAPLPNIGISSQAAFYYSRGDTVPAGVAAPLADIAQSLTLGTQITVPPPVVIARKTLNISPASAVFSFEAGQTSAAQTFTLSNSGNTALTVSSINYTQNGGVTAQATYGWSGALVLGAGDSATFSLAYTGANPGSAANSFTVVSDNDAGPITVPTTQIVSAPAPVPFTFDISPGSLSFSVTDPYSNPVFDFYIINATGSYSVMDVVVNGFSPGDSLRYVIPQSLDYYASIYNSNNFSLRYQNIDGNGTYLNSVSVTINGVTRTVNLAVTRNVYIPANRNLGTWLSPLSSYNAVIGASYDIINDQRYLTLGVGMGADGSPDLDRGGIGNVDYGAITFLGLAADDNYQAGPVLYPSRSLGLPGILASISEGGYGTWIISRETNDYWTNVLGNRRVPNSYFGNFDYKYLNYGFNCPSDGNYIIEFGLAADNGYCQIDGNLAIDLRGGGNSYAISNTVRYLGAGFHSTDIVFSGGTFCAIAMRITRQSDNLEVWSTRRPVRGNTPFRWWTEAYRIPIYANGTYMVHQSANYCMKSIRMIEADQTGYRWGDYCGDGDRAGSMFTVIDDGYGNLTIELNQVRYSLDQDKGSTRTLLMLAGSPLIHSFIYWTKYNRYRDLEAQGSTGDYLKSNYFVGFNSDGSVRTTLVDNFDIQNIAPVEIIPTPDFSGTGPAGNSGACCCFVADTAVATPSGEKLIQSITPGSWVLSGSGQPTRVLGIIRPSLDRRPLYDIDGQQATGDHLFKTPTGWACADVARYRETRWNQMTNLECGLINLGSVPGDQIQSLLPGSKILTVDGVRDIKTVSKIQDPDPDQLVYSLVTESGDYQLASGHIVDGIPQI